MQAERFESYTVPGIDFGSLEASFDINAAFQSSISSTASNEALALDEKVRRMEVLVSESTSAVYRAFVDFRSMAAQMELFCNHDHALNQAIRGNQLLGSFMHSHSEADAHGHADHHHKLSHKEEDDDEEYDIDPKTGKRIKKKRS